MLGMDKMTSQNAGTRVQYESNSSKALFHAFMHDLSEILDFQAGSLFLVEKNSHSLREVANWGDGIDFINQVHFPMGSGLSAWVAQKGKVIYLPDIHRGSRHGLNPVRSYLSMPLEINSRVVGVLNLGHTVPNAFDKPRRQKIECLLREVTRKLYNRTYLDYIANVKKDTACR